MPKLLTANDGDYIQLPWGELIFHNNELEIHTNQPDAPGISFTGVAGNSKVSYKDGRIEKTLLILRKNEKGDGEFYFGCLSQALYDTEVARGNSKAGDTAMIEVATLNPDHFEIRVPIKASAGFVSGGVSVSIGDRIQDPTHRFQTIQQGDGNLVVYDTSTSPWTALWNSGTVTA